MHWVYILHSEEIDRFYIGESADPETRVRYHRAGTSAYTSRASDWNMVFRRKCCDRNEALALEQKIKRSKSRKSIQRWIRGADNELVVPTTPPAAGVGIGS